MQDSTSLSNLQKRYAQGDLCRKDFEGFIFKNLLNSPEHYHLFEGNLDRWQDYLSWLYPRISRAIDLYKDTGASFGAYINTIVRYSSREYRCREAQHFMTEYACWKAKAEELAVQSPEPEYRDRRFTGQAVRIVLTPQQILMMMLKSYYYMSEDLLDRISRATEIDGGEIRRLVDKMRKLRNERDGELRGLEERIQCQYYRILAFENRLSFLTRDSISYDMMLGRLSRARRRFQKMKARLLKIRKTATNRQIAEVMGIPKGTVDSGLYIAKKRLRTKRSNLDQDIPSLN